MRSCAWTAGVGITHTHTHTHTHLKIDANATTQQKETYAQVLVATEELGHQRFVIAHLLSHLLQSTLLTSCV